LRGEVVERERKREQVRGVKQGEEGCWPGTSWHWQTPAGDAKFLQQRTAIDEN
jgi:hypothetical protein